MIRPQEDLVVVPLGKVSNQSAIKAFKKTKQQSEMLMDMQQQTSVNDSLSMSQRELPFTEEDVFRIGLGTMTGKDMFE